MIIAVAFSQTAHATDDVRNGLITFKQNGGWCWFSEERIIVDQGNLIIGSVAGTTNAYGAGGDIQLTTWNRNTQAGFNTLLAGAFSKDDHNNPSILRRTDGKYLVTYQKHGGDDLLRWRISTNPNSTASFGPEQTLDVNPNNDYGTTYSNLYYLPAEGRTYSFMRAVGYDPNYAYSDNEGTTWTYGDRNIISAAGNPGRPYARYVSNGYDRIWFQITDDHPRDWGNNVYTGYIQGGNMYNALGQLKGPLYTPGVTAVTPASFTKVYTGDANHRGWTTDIEIDPATNQPFMAFSAREIVGGVTTLKYYYSRFNGSTWVTNPLAYAGNYLYAAENDYTGLVALDPSNPNVLFISTDVDPATGAAVGSGKHEIYKGSTSDGGATWTWRAITNNSTVDNIRPIVPKWNSEERALLWLRGTYNTYTDYNMDIVGQIQFAPGDANGDRTVNFDDLLALAQNYGATGGKQWADGDFTDEGAVNFDDLLILSQRYGSTSFEADWALAQSLVPEPALIALPLVFVRRRRRNRSLAIAPNPGPR